MHRNYRRQVRPGMTTIELLVVIAIIAVLAGLVSYAVLRMIPGQQYSNTVTGLKLISGKATTQWRAVSDDAMNDTLGYENWLNSNPGGTQAAYVQARLKQAFPVTFYEALNPGPGLTALQQYSAYLSGVTANQGSPQPYEGAVCLLMALTKGPHPIPADSDIFGTANVATLSGNLQGIIDGFKTPLSVARSTNGLVLTSAGPDMTLGTSDDLVSTNLK